MKVRALIINESNQVLLGFDPSIGQYSLPGGNAEAYETPEQAMAREIYEEAALEVVSSEYLFEHMDNGVYLVSVKDKGPTQPNGLLDPDQEFSRLEYFNLFSLPTDISEFSEEIVYTYLRNTCGSFSEVLSGKIDVMIDGKKVYELDDDEIWTTLPRLAQERTKGKKVTFRPQNKTVESDNIGTVDQIVQDLIDVHFPGMEVPTIEPVKTSDFLGETLYTDGKPYIRINDVVFYNPRLFKQVLAHELIHYFLYKTYGSGVDQHGPEFKEIAKAINEIEGKDYISETANGTKFT